MRKIKFRAWHFKLNRMFSAEEMTQDQMALLPDGHFANIHGSDTNKSVIYPHTSMLPLQFTGLHDKNGKEIYEGDILATSQSDPESDHDIWDEEEYGYTVVEWSNWHCGFRGSRWMWHHDSSLQYGLEFIKVIGNIYENPNLLEGKDG